VIQFLGLNLSGAEATVAVLGRDLHLWARTSAKVLQAVRDPASGVTEVPVAEWVRAGAYALEEAYFQLPTKARKPWGLGLAGKSGWIALDVDFEPLSPLRLVDADSPREDLRRWLAENPRLARRIGIVLSAKDYFRFALSGGLAADVSNASRLGLLQVGESQWSEAQVKRAELRLSWLPPVFDAHVPTGRLSEEGMRRTSLPGGCWLVAGAHEDEAALVAAGDLRRQEIWRLVRPGGRDLLAYGIGDLEPHEPPPGWRLVRSALVREQILERDGDGEADVQKAREEIAAAGFHVAGVRAASAEPEVGAAALAAIGSGLVKGWDAYYRHRVVEPPAA